ncbi:unnamed protein product [Pleuronectes platessa]|uniref:Uncharacterized protein n=1 Tax=Pleuronectes platessa TaxID=8262 RepID=A0A9N7VHS1_PLEPL|nr:unnamed protein product [Pleuronectes platessa]
MACHERQAEAMWPELSHPGSLQAEELLSGEGVRGDGMRSDCMESHQLCYMGGELCYRPSTARFLVCSPFPARITRGRPADSESDLDSYKHCGRVKLQVLQGNSRGDEGEKAAQAEKQRRKLSITQRLVGTELTESIEQMVRCCLCGRPQAGHPAANGPSIPSSAL